jgi:hypothetical protein
MNSPLKTLNLSAWIVGLCLLAACASDPIAVKSDSAPSPERNALETFLRNSNPNAKDSLAIRGLLGDDDVDFNRREFRSRYGRLGGKILDDYSSALHEMQAPCREDRQALEDSLIRLLPFYAKLTDMDRMAILLRRKNGHMGNEALSMQVQNRMGMGINEFEFRKKNRGLAHVLGVQAIERYLSECPKRAELESAFN